MPYELIRKLHKARSVEKIADALEAVHIESPMVMDSVTTLRSIALSSIHEVAVTAQEISDEMYYQAREYMEYCWQNEWFNARSLALGPECAAEKAAAFSAVAREAMNV